MTTPLVKADIEAELKISFESYYTDTYFTELANYALAALENATNRSTFSGNSQYLAKKAMICAAVDWISMFDPKLFSAYISNISEDGASISFDSNTTLKSYETQFKNLITKLKLPSTQNHGITIPDITGTHLSTDGHPLY